MLSTVTPAVTDSLSCVRRAGTSTRGAPLGDDPVVAERIVDDPCDGLSPGDDARHHAEERQAGREIEGAVDRIDDDREIGTASLSRSAGSAATDSSPMNTAPGAIRVDIRLDQPLGGLVAFRHQVDRFRFHPHIAGSQDCESAGDFPLPPLPAAGWQVRRCRGMAHSLGSGERDWKSKSFGSSRCEAFTCPSARQHRILAARHAPLDIRKHRLHCVALGAHPANHKVAGDDRELHGRANFARSSSAHRQAARGPSDRLVVEKLCRHRRQAPAMEKVHERRSRGCLPMMASHQCVAASSRAMR